MTADEAEARLRELADDETANVMRGFFKTGPGQYGVRAAQFLGIKVTPLRPVARQFQHLPLGEVRKLLCSSFHEARIGPAGPRPGVREGR